jgi:hypothetical protein
METATIERGSQSVTLEVLARMTGNKIEVRDIITKFLLITYDIPVTVAGNKARSKFLAEARIVGATAFTESVYLMPWTPEAELIALQVAKVGRAVVWTSAVTDEAQAAEITKGYDANLKKIMDEANRRIERMSLLISTKQENIARRMWKKTNRIMTSLESAITRRGNIQFYVLFCIMNKRFVTLPI